MRKLILITIALTLLAGSGWSQSSIKRHKTQTNHQTNHHKTGGLPPEEAESQVLAAEAGRRAAEARKKKQPDSIRKATVSNPDGQIAGHGYVDLGLPSGLKWATCNVGASSASDYGSYFAWGETSTKSSYDKDNSLTYENSISKLRSEGIIGSDGNLTLSHDAARYNWGSTWRMPTRAECKELVENCTWTWTWQGGTKGYVVTGRNGKSIFLPCAGWRSGASLDYAGEYGYCWSSTPYGSYLAYRLDFRSGSLGTYRYYRYYGFSVRPVTE